MSGGVFVAGGTGFVGKAIVERLVAGGRRVVGLARSDAAARTLRSFGAESAPGDVRDIDALVAAMRGCEVAYHAAGLNTLCPRDRAALFRVNVLGSRTVARAAVIAGVRRLVYTSSAATLGEARGTTGYEGSPHRGWFLSDYERSKFEAERAVLETARGTGLEVVCVNPSSVQGPGRTEGTARLLIDYLSGRLKVVVDGRMSILDTADCTTGHLLAETNGGPGERYVLSGATLTVREAVALVAEIAGGSGRPRALPPFVAMAVATIVEPAARAAGRRPPLCRDLVRTLLHGPAYDGSKAARELGLRYTPVAETFRRAVAWYVEHGLVRGRSPDRSARREE